MHECSYFKYPRISRSSGAMLARTFPCVITTPLGSAVVPEVKTICRTSWRVSAMLGMSPAGGATIPASLPGSGSDSKTLWRRIHADAAARQRAVSPRLLKHSHGEIGRRSMIHGNDDDAEKRRIRRKPPSTRRSSLPKSSRGRPSKFLEPRACEQIQKPCRGSRRR